MNASRTAFLAAAAATCAAANAARAQQLTKLLIGDPPSDPGINVALTPPVSDPWPNGDPPGDPPIITVTTSVDPVDEPSSGIVLLGGLTSLLLFRRARRFRPHAPQWSGAKTAR